MIHRYNKTNKNIDLNNNPNIKFLAFCNWSFVKEKHLKEKEALTLFDNFEIEKSPFYVRIFNEMPKTVLNDFITRNNIDKNKVLNIYKNLIQNTSYKVDKYE
jgi:hypothetical protein